MSKILCMFTGLVVGLTWDKLSGKDAEKLAQEILDRFDPQTGQIVQTEVEKLLGMDLATYSLHHVDYISVNHVKLAGHVGMFVNVFLAVKDVPIPAPIPSDVIPSPQDMDDRGLEGNRRPRGRGNQRGQGRGGDGRGSRGADRERKRSETVPHTGG